MKRILFLMIFAMASIVTYGQGIKFEETKFADLLAKAKSENKPIFIDAYTSWCAPCKLMAKNIFPLQSVGDYYNSHFINTKFDMEKGEGKEIAKKYGVISFPTYLIIDKDGEVIHRSGSSLSEQEFLQFAKDAQDPSKQMPIIKKKFAKGGNDQEFLKIAIQAFLKTGDINLAEKALDEYFSLKKTNDLSNGEINLVISAIYQNPAGKYYTFFKERKNDILKLMTQSTYDNYDYNFNIGAIYKKSYDKKTRKTNESIFASEVEKIFGKEKAPQIMLKVKADKALHDKDYATYEKLALDLYKDYSTATASELNSAAWNFFENVSNKYSLEKALTWVQESVKKEESYSNTDTLANIYSKLGDRKNAVEYAKKAIELAKREGRDFSKTQKLLEN